MSCGRFWVKGNQVAWMSSLNYDHGGFICISSESVMVRRSDALVYTHSCAVSVCLKKTPKKHAAWMYTYTQTSPVIPLCSQTQLLWFFHIKQPVSLNEITQAVSFACSFIAQFMSIQIEWNQNPMHWLSEVIKNIFPQCHNMDKFSQT